MIALMYHDVVAPGAGDTSGFPGRDAASYKVTIERFTEHLDAIVERGADKNCALTFDDGGISAITAADYLELHGLRGHFFVTANYIGTRGFVDPSAMRDLDRRGHIVGSHSCSHPLRMGHVPWIQLLDEWTSSRAILSDVLGHPIFVASVPGGDYAGHVARAAAEAGFAELFTSEPTAQDHHAFGIAVHGRFTIRRWTTAQTAAGLASGDRLPRLRQGAVWSAAKIGKYVAGRGYLRLRDLLMGRSAQVQWGD